MIYSPLKPRGISVENIGGGEQRVSFLNNYITQGFGYTNFSKTGVYGYDTFGNPKPHNGIDLRASTGTMVFAPISGTCKVEKSSTGYGNNIRIKNDDWECVLGHLSSFIIKDGDTVMACDPIARSGSTGNSSAPHLHFGIRPLKNGKVVGYDTNFYGYINPMEITIEWYGTFANQSNYSGLQENTLIRTLSREL